MIIDQLPLLAGNALTTDEIPIERGVTTYKATLLQALGSVFDTIEPNFADAYDKTATYSVGDYVIYENSLYKCNTAILTAEEWDATHWTQVNVAEELLAILSAVSTKQDKITASGILKGSGAGIVSAATKGADYGALSFTVTLDDASWSNNAQTVSNANFLASGYGYIVTPASASFADYASAVIYADNVSTDGSMTFHCSTAPSSDLTVNILRVVSA